MSGSFYNCSIPVICEYSLVELVARSGRLIRLNYNDNQLGDESLQKLASIARVSPFWMEFIYDEFKVCAK